MRLVRLMCSGRVDLAHLLRSFARGADGVFIGGCRFGECNYITHGNYHALNLSLLCRRILEHIGLNPKRLHIAFMSGGEGNLFASVVDDFCKTIKELGPIGQSDKIAPADLDAAISEVTPLIPYIKIEKHDKLTARLKSEVEYQDHFSLDEVRSLLTGAASYYIDPEKCQACMICARSCPVDAIESGKGLIHVIDQDKCIKCGTCLQACPSRFGAITRVDDGPPPPALPQGERTIVRKVGRTNVSGTSTQRAMP
jgi:F420-non-reducing hydrogenase iron-sulfur subunit